MRMCTDRVTQKRIRGIRQDLKVKSSLNLTRIDYLLRVSRPTQKTNIFLIKLLPKCPDLELGRDGHSVGLIYVLRAKN